MIGQTIKSIRLNKGITLSELAQRSGVAKSYISAIERSIQVNPSIQVLEKISSVLEVSVYTLLETDNHAETEDESIDPEWLQLAEEAMKSGISKQQFKEFLEFQKWQRNKEK